MEEEDRLRKLKWPPLETHRLFFSLVECYKIVFGTNKLNFDDLFQFTKCNSTCANHPCKVYVNPAKWNPLPIWIIRDWNSLPRSIVEAGSPSHFITKFTVSPCAFCKLLRNFGFFCSVIHLSGPLRKCMFTCDWCNFDPHCLFLCFKVRSL